MARTLAAGTYPRSGPRPVFLSRWSSGDAQCGHVGAAKAASVHQRAWFAELHDRVAAGAPLAVVNADSPHELFRSFGVPYVVNQWWASVVAAKQKSGQYLAELRDRGYPDWTDQYGSLALASSFAADDDPPWGGLPRPTFVVAHLTDDAQRKIFELWARESGAVVLRARATVANAIPPSWHETSSTRLGGSHRKRPPRI